MVACPPRVDASVSLEAVPAVVRDDGEGHVLRDGARPRDSRSKEGQGFARDDTRLSQVQKLRAQIQRIEARGASCFADMSLSAGDADGMSRTPTANRWQFGVEALDQRLGVDGLELGGVHEIKPGFGVDQARGPGDEAVAGQVVSALAFAFRLAKRRMIASDDRSSVLWCATSQSLREYGALYGPGLRAFGCDHRRIITVEARRSDDALWVMEEALRSQAVGAVIAHVDAIDLTPARRLALAAQAGATPCIVVSGHASHAMAATATRWRVAPVTPVLLPRLEASGPSSSYNDFLHDLAVRGGPPVGLCQVQLERCRRHVSAGACPPLILEWSDETLSFRLAAALANGAVGPRAAAGGAEA